jgi:short-subunit dehydrogenase
MSLKQKYGSLALVAGASEGLGAAYASYLASEGIDLILVARRKEPLELLANSLKDTYKVKIECLSCDLANSTATQEIKAAVGSRKIDILVYNAAIPHIGAFENNPVGSNNQMAQANMVTPMNLVQLFGAEMLERKKGAVIMMASLAGFQGSGFLTVYAATKAFDRVLAEGLWYEWKDRGVDVIACCAGATATPNFIKTKPEKASFFAPRVQEPEEVVKECFQQLGKTPSFITGRGNKFASFIMQRLLPRQLAITIMGDTARQMYRL